MSESFQSAPAMCLLSLPKILLRIHQFFFQANRKCQPIGEDNWKNFNTFLQYFACERKKNFIFILCMPSDIFHFFNDGPHRVPLHKFTTIEKHSSQQAPSTCFINLLPIYQIFIKLKSRSFRFRYMSMAMLAMERKCCQNGIAGGTKDTTFSFAWKIKLYFSLPFLCLSPLLLTKYRC